MQNKKQSRRKTLCVEVERNKMPDPEEDQAGPKVPVQTGRFRPISDRYPQEVVEALALQKPPIPVAALHRQICKIAQRRGENIPTYKAVYRIVRDLPKDLLTVAAREHKSPS